MENSFLLMTKGGRIHMTTIKSESNESNGLALTKVTESNEGNKSNGEATSLATK